MKPHVSIIVAVDRNYAIGRGGDMLFYVGDDLRRFKALTMGHPIVMGRRTFESLPKGALPGRRNIVITRNESYTAPGAETAASLDEALRMAAAGTDEIFVIGGGSIYEAAMPMADTLYLTHIEAAADDADTYFPRPGAEWTVAEESPLATDARTGLPYRFVTLKR